MYNMKIIKIYNLWWFFCRMFRVNEDIRIMFVWFCYLKIEDEICVSEFVEKYVIFVMGIFDEFIFNIDNVDYVFDVFKVIG